MGIWVIKMKTLKLAKVIVSALIIVSTLVLNPIGASAEWKQDNIGWWNTEENSWSLGWKEIDGKWYYFWGNGYMAHDTIVNGYKLGSDGSWIQTTQNSYEELDKLPKKYFPALAQKNGDVVGSVIIKRNPEKLDKFIENYKDNKMNVGDMVRITIYTDEGDAIINDLIVDSEGIKLINDNTRDGYAGTGRGRKEYKVIDVYKTYKNNFIDYYVKTEQNKDILLYCY